MNGNTLTINGEQLESEEEVQVLDNGLTMPNWIGDYDLYGDSTLLNDKYMKNVIEYRGYYDNTVKTVKMTVKRRKVQVDVIEEELQYDEALDDYNYDHRETVRSDEYEYKQVGYAFRRLYKECGIDLKKHNISFDFSLK